MLRYATARAAAPRTSLRVHSPDQEEVEKSADIRLGLERAVALDKPAVVNVITDLGARPQTMRFSTYRAM